MSNWKNAERSIADKLTKSGIPAKRISRAGNYSQSIHDIEVDKPLDILKIDSKYTKMAPFVTNRLLREIREKYCKQHGDEPVLVTRNYKEHGAAVTIEFDFFVELLRAFTFLYTGKLPEREVKHSGR